MDTEQYDVGFYGLMEHMDTREILAAIGLFLWCVVRLSGDAAKNLK